MFKGKYMEWSILIISVVLYIYTYFAPWATTSATTEIGLTFFPRILLGLIILSSIILLFILREDVSINEEDISERKQRFILFLYPLSMIGLILVVWHVGMVTGMYIFLVLWMYYFGLRARLTLFLLPLICSLCLYYLFKIADVFIPEGLLF